MNFDINPRLGKRHSDILFLISFAIFYAASLLKPMLELQANIVGSIAGLGILFFLFSAPFALVKAETKPSNYGSSAFAAFLMYCYLPLSIYWLRKRHLRLLETLNKKPERSA
ncbi:hypothetical protein [Hyphococcus sp.]|uniref:hypothetical protein n=1 Tax=Hyphococcus sp. TaxID=2038636 RepID=UPI003CCBC4D2